MAMKQALAQRLLSAVEMGHKPEFYSAPQNKLSARPGVGVRCSCGWVGPNPKPLREYAKAAFFWHLEEVLKESRESA